MSITYEELDAIDRERRRVLIAFSKELRERNGDGGSGASDLANAASQLRDADLIYLQKQQDNPILKFDNKTPLDVINHIKSLNSTSYDTEWWSNKFANPQESFNNLVIAAPPTPPPAARGGRLPAAAGVRVGGQGGEGPAGGVGGPRGAAPPPTDHADGGHEGGARGADGQGVGGPRGAAPPTPLRHAESPSADAAGGGVPGDEEAERRKQLLELLNTSSRPCLQVFDEYDQKKKQYDAKLEKFLGDDPTSKKNKGSAFIRFISPYDQAGKSNVFLPYVTKTDFHKILNQASFANTASQYAVACKMELKKGEEIEMGASTLSDQCFIDVQDSPNHTRIFLSKQNFKKLEEYKKNLAEEFKKLLENDISKIGASTKDEIQDKIFKFGSIKDVKGAIGGVPASPVPVTPPNALSSDSLASIVDLTSTDDIDKYARKLADQFWQRKLMKGDLSVEAENTSFADGYDEAQRLGHIKIERTDEDGIKVYKVGSDNEIGLDHVNLGMGNQMMQIEVKKITKDGVTGVEYFKQNAVDKNNFNVRVDNKKDLNETVKKAKVDVFVEDSAEKKMTRFKISGGKNKSEKKIGNIAIRSQPLAQAPKIFTIGTGGVSEKIGTANGYKLGYFPLPNRIVGRGDVDIKIRRSENGNYKIQYGDEASYPCHSYLSTTKKAYFINPVITKIDEKNVKLIKKGAFLRKSWFFSKDSSYFKTGDTESIKIFVEDKDMKKIVELEITQESSMKGGFKDFFCAKRNNNVVKVVSERSTVPPTTFQPQNVLSLAPVVHPSLGRPGP